MKKYDDIVVGSGVSGLTMSLLLAMNGQRVLLLEKGPHIGGSLVPVLQTRHLLRYRLPFYRRAAPGRDPVRHPVHPRHPRFHRADLSADPGENQFVFESQGKRFDHPERRREHQKTSSRSIFRPKRRAWTGISTRSSRSAPGPRRSICTQTRSPRRTWTRIIIAGCRPEGPDLEPAAARAALRICHVLRRPARRDVLCQPQQDGPQFLRIHRLRERRRRCLRPRL